MIVVCPDCKGFDDRPFDLCGMCWETSVGTAVECLHTRYERFNAGCECPPEPCERCGAETNDDGTCWRCDNDPALGEPPRGSRNDDRGAGDAGSHGKARRDA